MRLKGLAFICAFYLTQSFAADPTLEQVLAASVRTVKLSSTLKSNTTTKMITKAKGGEIQLKTKDGSEFTLTFPAGSVPYDSNISLSEIQKIQINSQSYASLGVQIYPDGMQLVRPAKLFIKGPRAFNKKSFSAMTSTNAGLDTHVPHITKLNDQSVELGLLHFSNYIISDDAKVQEIIDLGMPDTELLRINNWVNKKIENYKKDPSNNDLLKDLKNSIKETIAKVVVPKLLAAKTCEGADNALASYYSLERSIQLLGLDSREFFGDATDEAFTSAGRVTRALCMQEAKELCQVKHEIPKAIQLWQKVERFASLTGDEELSSAVDSASEKCMKFKFFMESEFRSGPPGMSYPGITAISEFDLQFTLGGTLVAQAGYLNAIGMIEPIYDFKEGEVSIVDVFMKVEGLNCNRDSMIAPPGQMLVANFIADEMKGKQILRIGGPAPAVVANFTCKAIGSTDTFPLQIPMGGEPKYFLGMFTAAHAQTGLGEMQPDGYFNLKKAVFRKDSKYIEAVYNHFVQGVIHEITTITIHHTPED